MPERGRHDYDQYQTIHRDGSILPYGFNDRHSKMRFT
jgi:hypothetical protein